MTTVLVFLRCVCVCMCVCVCACVCVCVSVMFVYVCACVCGMLISFVSALGSHEMGRHKLPIIIIIIKQYDGMVHLSCSSGDTDSSF